MIINENYLYHNIDTDEYALGGVDVLLAGDQAKVCLAFITRNNGDIRLKAVQVLQDEWDMANKESI